MLQENELITLLLGIGVLLFVVLSLPRLKKFPNVNWLLLALAGQAIAWIFTVLETWYFPVLFNGIEHFGYALCSVSLLVWALVPIRTVGGQR